MSLQEILSRVGGIRARLSIGRLLFVMVMYGALFGVLRVLDVPPVDSCFIFLFVTVVGIGQTLLFNGEQRALASMILGAGFVLGFIILAFGLQWRVLILFGPVEGAIAGLVCGRIIAGAFWIFGWVTNAEAFRRHG
jgi:hypothetical protein